MKRKLLPLLIAGVAAASANVALAGVPTLYGKVNVTLNKYDLEQRSGTAAVDQKDDWELESNASRLGVKGDYDINATLKAIYKLEYQVDIDNGTNSNGRELSQRNIYGGFQSTSWGSLIGGKNDTPLKLIQTTAAGSEIDRFNDLPIGDIQNIMVGENRADNIIMYTTPVFSGFGATLAVMPGEESGQPTTTAGVTTKNDNDGFADRTSVAVYYNSLDFYVGLAADQNVQNADVIRLAGEVTLGPVKVGALYQTAEKNDDPTFTTATGASIPGFFSGISATGSTMPAAADFTTSYDEQDAWLLGGEWKINGDWKLKAQYGYSESTPLTVAQGDTELTLMAVGADYKLNDFSKLFAYYASIEGEGETSTGLSVDTIEDKTFAVGYEIKF